MTDRFCKLFISFVVAQTILLAGAVRASGGVGFQATLEGGSIRVSSYRETEDRFSAAIYPKTQAFLGPRLKRTPAVTGSDFESGTLTFATEYYRIGRNPKRLIPLSVTSDAYLAYRRDKITHEKFDRLMTNSISNPQKGRKKGGLGVRVALPKRLDKIFGEGGAGLKVAGMRRITFSGRSQWTDAANTPGFQQSKFPALTMEQISRFDITGTIGTKISVKVKQDSETDIPLANRIQIRYKGDEDDVLQAIEAGNTTLSLPNTRFVGYSSRIQGLFGLKAVAQVGGMKLTAIASQEKGSTEQASYNVRGEERAEYMRDYEYAEGRLFDLFLPEELTGDSIVKLSVYELQTDPTKPGLLKANMFVKPDSVDAYKTENKKDINVLQVSDETYEFFSFPSVQQHYIHFKVPKRNYALAVYMEVERADGGGIRRIGDVSGSPLQLKMIRDNLNDATSSQRTWDLMWRNCYSIPRDVLAEDLKVRIFKGQPDAEGGSGVFEYQQSLSGTQNYIEILGLDQRNRSDQLIPDRELDDREEVFRPDWGLIIFPSRKPFDSDTTFGTEGNKTVPLAEKVPELYNYTSTQEKQQATKYYIQYAALERSSIIKLNRANIIEGSERVIVNGRSLARGTDYNIQYDFGQITLLSNEATDPNADLRIEYEFAPFLALQKKSLLGVRAEYDFGDNFKIGSTILYKSDKAEERKPRIGQETARALVFDVDGELKLHPNFLTTAVDAIPLVETEVPSNMSIQAEVAESHPNPNVEGVAYVDDFEAAEEQLSLGISRTTWHEASEPLQLSKIVNSTGVKNFVKGKLLWHQDRDLIDLKDVYKRDVQAGQGTLRPFRMIFRPQDTAYTLFYDSTGSVVDSVNMTTGHPSWGGITRYFSNRVDASRVQLFEIRLKTPRSNNSKLHFDFGFVSEDVDGDGELDEEGFNGFVTKDEDLGLDGLSDGVEISSDGRGYDPVTNPDPAGDNWSFNEDEPNDSLYYEFLNGTEGNIDDPQQLGIADREQLSSNGFNQNNAYFTYVVDFSDSVAFEVEGSRDTITDWWTLRIPILAPEYKDSFHVDEGLKPEWNRISDVRVWFESDASDNTPDTVEIADWYFVQSSWIARGGEEDSLSQFTVATISKEDNTFFTPPPQAQSYTDPNTDVTETQRALLLSFDSLAVDSTYLAEKELITVDRFGGYRRIQMYVHSDIDINDDGKVQLFFRLGRDTANFYEYHTMLYRSAVLWDKQNWINIDFNEITALKDAAQRNLPKDKRVADVDTTDGPYRVFGAPNINEVRYYAIGLINKDSTGKRVSGEVWLDELRVTDVRRDVGRAGRLAVSGNLADLFSYGFTAQSRDPYFRKLSTATRGGSGNNLGSGKTDTRYDYNATLSLHKFLPRVWGANIPVSVRASKQTVTPLLRNNSDVVLPEDVRREEQTINESQGVTVSERFAYKGKNLLFSLLLNRLTSNMSYQRGRRKSVTQPYSFSENITLSSSYDMSIRNGPKLPLFFWTKSIPILRKAADSKLGLTPGAWNWRASFSRNLSISDDVNNNRRTSLSRNFEGTMSLSYAMFESLTSSFSYSTRRDLIDLDQLKLSLSDPKIGLETRYSQNFSAKYDPNILGFFTTSFNYRATYTDDYDRASLTRRSGLSESHGVSGRLNHQSLFGGKSRRGARQKARRREVRGGGKKEAPPGKPFYAPALGALRFLTGWIEPVSYTYNQTFNNSVPGMLSRPSLNYRFGFNREAGVETKRQGRTPSSAEGKTYDLSSSFKLLGGLTTGVKFRRSMNRDLVRQGARFKEVRTSWPDLSIRIQKFSTLPLLKPVVNYFIHVFAPRTGYSRQTSQREDLDGGFFIAKTESISYSPLLSINFKVFTSLSLSGSYTKSTEVSEKFNPANGSPQSESRTSRNSMSLSTRWSFSSPGGISLPLFGRLKFKSRVSLEVAVKVNESKSESAETGQPFRASADKSDFSWTANLGYNFSQQIKGGTTIRWSDGNDNIRNRKSHARELQAWVEIRF